MNYPGSSGYGQEFQERSRGDWGGADAARSRRGVRSLRAEVGSAVRSACTARVTAVTSHCWWPRRSGGCFTRRGVGTGHRPPPAARRRVRRATAVARGGTRRAADRPRRLALPSPIARSRAGRHAPAGRAWPARRPCPVEQSRRLVRLLSDRPPTEGSVRYLEEAESPHTPATWGRWTGAVMAHFGPWNAPLPGRRGDPR